MGSLLILLLGGLLFSGVLIALFTRFALREHVSVGSVVSAVLLIVVADFAAAYFMDELFQSTHQLFYWGQLLVFHSVIFSLTLKMPLWKSLF